MSITPLTTHQLDQLNRDSALNQQVQLGTKIQEMQDDIVGYVSVDEVQTLTMKTLTTPVIASIYQDTGKTKLLTIPNTASDTLVALAATQTLSNKTLSSPAIVQKTVSHDYAAGVVAWTLTTDELKAGIIKVTNASGAVNAIFDAGIPNMYMVDNRSGFALTCKNAAGTTVVIASTKRAIVWNEGTNIVRITADA